MLRASIVALVLTASATHALAGGFLGLGIGTAPGINDEAKAKMAPSGRSARFLGGYSFGRFSVEGAVGGFGVSTTRGDQTAYQASASGKYNLPLGDKFEAFGRAGLEHTSVSMGDARYDFSGNGVVVGAGFEYRVDVGFAKGSLFVDYNIHHATLTSDSNKTGIGETTRMFSLGLTVGI
jgi:hypothetical protein